MSSLDDIRQLAERARRAGATPPPSEALIFHLEAKDKAAAEALIPALNAELGDVARADWMFIERTDEKARFVRLEFPDVDSELAEPAAFDAAYSLADRYDLISAEPDLPTSYFVEPGQKPPTTNAESAIVNLLCEVGGDPPPDHLWAVNMMRANQAMAWSTAQGRPAGGAGIRVAQPDTGITVNPEFEPGAIEANNGWDILRGQAGAIDPLDYVGNKGHGTSTAGCVVSRPQGQAQGSAPAAELYPIRCIKAVTVFQADPVTRAIEHAVVTAKAQVITMSLGGVPDRAMKAALKDAVSKGVIVLAAAGNCVGVVVWPARYADCIAVGGCNIDARPWKGSCRGSPVDITAPAEQVWVASAQNPAAHDSQGTSFAVALTAGAAAQWLAHHGVAAVQAEAAKRHVRVQDLFRTALQATAEPSPHLPTDKFGPGVVNIEKLLKLDLASIPPATAPAESLADQGGGAPPREFVELLKLFGAAESADIDWRLYGRELGQTALQRAFSARAEGVELAETTAPPTSNRLREAARQSGDHGLAVWAGAREPALS